MNVLTTTSIMMRDALGLPSLKKRPVSTIDATSDQKRVRENRDFVQVLPMELCNQILDCLCENDIASISLVSHAWNNLFVERLVNTGPAVSCIASEKALDHYLVKRKAFFKDTPEAAVPRLHRLELRGAQGDRGKILLSLAKYKVYVENIGISLSSDISLNRLLQRSKGAKKLFGGFKSLTLQLDVIRSFRALGPVVQLLANLVELRLFVVVSSGKLEAIPLSHRQMLPSLKHLCVAPLVFNYDGFQEDPGLQLVHNEFVRQVKMPKLSELSLRCYTLEADALRKLATSHLKSLDFSDLKGMTFFDLVDAFQGTSVRLERLKYYNHNDPSPITPQDLSMSSLDFSFLAELKRLILSEPNLLPVSIMRLLIATNKGLKELMITAPFATIVLSNRHFFHYMMQLCPDLQTLSVDELDGRSFTCFTNALARWHKTVPLQKLYLRLFNVSKTTLASITEANKSLKFRQLYLCASSVSKEWCQELDKANPDTSVFRILLCPTEFTLRTPWTTDDWRESAATMPSS